MTEAKVVENFQTGLPDRINLSFRDGWLIVQWYEPFANLLVGSFEIYGERLATIMDRLPPPVMEDVFDQLRNAIRIREQALLAIKNVLNR